MKNIYIRFLFLFTLVSFFFLSGCVDKVKDFTAPTFDQDIYAPIIVKTYTIEDLVEDDTATIKSYDDPDRLGLLYYSKDETFDPIRVDDQLTMQGFTTTESKSLNPLSVGDIGPVSAKLELASWTPVSPGQSIIFPAVSDNFTVDFPQISQFRVAVFDTPSEIWITFENRLPVTTVLSSLSLRNSDGTIIAASPVTLTLAPNGGKDSLNLLLANSRMQNQIRIQGDISTPGSSGSTVTVPSDGGTYITARFNDINIKQATAVFPAQAPVVFSKNMVIDDSTTFTQVLLRSGQLSIELQNIINLPFDATLQINDLQTAGGQPFTQTFSFTGVDSQAASYNIAGWYLRSATETNKLAYTVTFNSYPATVETTVKNTDSIQVQLVLNGLVIEEFSGRVKPTLLDVGQTSFQLDVSDIEKNFTYDQIDVSDPSLILNLNFSANLEVGFSGVLVARNSSTVKTAAIPYQVLQPRVPNEVIIDKTELRNLLNGFSQKLPDSVYVIADAIANPNYKLASVNALDSLFGDVHFELPLKLALTGGEFRDTVDVDIDSDIKNDADNINSAVIIFEIESEIPVDLTFSGRLEDINGQFMLNLPPNLDSIKINAATVDQNGEVVTKGKSLVEIPISHDDVLKLLDSKEAIAVFKLNTAGPDNDPVAFHLDDAVDVRIRAIINYQADLE